jgi:hypothetical protein
MDTETKVRIQGLARIFSDLRETLPIGCSNTQLRSVAGWMREINQHYGSLWRQAGFENSPMVKSDLFIEKNPDPKLIAVSFGGEEISTQASSIEVSLKLMGLKVPEGYILLDGPTATSWMTFNDHGVDRVDGNDPFIAHDFTIGEYFSSTIAYIEGINVSRFDVVKFVSYHLGAIHINVDRAHRENPSLDALKKMLNSEHFKRSDIYYLFLSVVQPIAFSSDVTRFIDRANRL